MKIAILSAATGGGHLRAAHAVEEYLRANAPEGSGRYAYFSVGKKEKRAGLPFRHVEEDLAACADILSERGCTVDVTLGPGNHMQHVTERLSSGLAALDAFLDQA